MMNLTTRIIRSYCKFGPLSDPQKFVDLHSKTIKTLAATYHIDLKRDDDKNEFFKLTELSNGKRSNVFFGKDEAQNFVAQLKRAKDAKKNETFGHFESVLFNQRLMSMEKSEKNIIRITEENIETSVAKFIHIDLPICDRVIDCIERQLDSKTVSKHYLYPRKDEENELSSHIIGTSFGTLFLNKKQLINDGKEFLKISEKSRGKRSNVFLDSSDVGRLAKALDESSEAKREQIIDAWESEMFAPLTLQKGTRGHIALIQDDLQGRSSQVFFDISKIPEIISKLGKFGQDELSNFSKPQNKGTSVEIASQILESSSNLKRKYFFNVKEYVSDKSRFVKLREMPTRSKIYLDRNDLSELIIGLGKSSNNNAKVINAWNSKTFQPLSLQLRDEDKIVLLQDERETITFDQGDINKISDALSFVELKVCK